MEWNNHPFEKRHARKDVWQPQRVGGLGRRELRSVHQARRMRAVRRDHGGVHRRRAGAAVGRQADRMSI